MKSFASMLGINTSEGKTCFLGTLPEEIAILVNGKEYFLRATPIFPGLNTAAHWNCAI